MRTVASVHIDNFWIMRNLQSEFGHTGRMAWIELGCMCTREMTLWHMRMAKTKISLRIRHMLHYVFMVIFVYLKRKYAQRMTKQDSGQSAHQLSMVHLYSKSFASLERCMYEKEGIRTACAPLIDRCGGAPGAQ